MRSLAPVLLCLLPACSSLLGSKNAVFLDVLDDGVPRGEVEHVLGTPVAEVNSDTGTSVTYRYAPKPPSQSDIEYMTLDDHGKLLDNSTSMLKAGRGAIVWPFVYGAAVIVGETWYTGKVLFRMFSGKRFLAGRVYIVEVNYDVRGELVSFDRRRAKATDYVYPPDSY